MLRPHPSPSMHTARDLYQWIMAQPFTPTRDVSRDLKKVVRNRSLIEYPFPLLIDLKQGKIKTWLDVGCGQGKALNTAKTAYPKLQCWGLDLQDFKIKNIDKKIIGDVSSLEMIPATFDAITDVYGAISYSANPVEVIRLLLNKLTVGGKLYIGTDNAFAEAIPLYDLLEFFRGTVILSEDGKLVDLFSYLKKNSQGLTFDISFNKNLGEGSLCEIIVTKISSDFTLPRTCHLRSRPDLPPLNVLIVESLLTQIQKDMPVKPSEKSINLFTQSDSTMYVVSNDAAFFRKKKNDKRVTNYIHTLIHSKL